MPIVFVHGVTVRTDAAFREVAPQLRSHVASRIRPDDPDAVKIVHCFWGDVGVRFAWDKASRPRTLLRQGPQGRPDPRRSAAGAETPIALAGAEASVPQARPSNLLSMGGVASPGEAVAAEVSIASLPAVERADLVVGFLAAAAGYPNDMAADGGVPDRAAAIDGHVTVAALDVARDEAITAELRAVPPQEQMRLAAAHTLLRARQQRGIVEGGPPTLAERAAELFGRALSAPGFLVSRAFGELRPVLSDFVADFLGDVLVYQTRRGTPGAPGPIPRRLLDALVEARRDSPAEEPLIVLTHSMGGQLAFDVFSTFARGDPRLAGLRVHFWASAGSQVAFFEDAKLFLGSDPDVAKGRPAPRDRATVPACVDAWWNVWDFNDFVSFTAEEVFPSIEKFGSGRNDGVLDEQFITGAGLALAHISYFKRPSFWQRFEAHLDDAGYGHDA